MYSSRKIFKELIKILPNKKEIDYYKLQIENSNIILERRVTDYDNYLYINKSFSKTSSNEIEAIEYQPAYSKKYIINNKYQCRISIEDAFNDIDPNNFAPN